MNYFKRLETIIIAFIILILGVGYGYLNTKQKVQPSTPNSAESGSQLTQDENQEPTEYVFYTGQDGRTAMDILRTFHSVETESFGGMGEFVTSIDGVDAGSTHFWAFYVNGEMSQVGADTYVTKTSDNIEWKLEKIN